MRDRDTEDTKVIIKGVLFCDGGSRGNPGPAGIGYVLEEEKILSKERTLLSYGGWFIGNATSNQAEYHALIWGLQNALALRVRTIEVYMDSELVVKQLNGVYKVSNARMRPLHRLASELLKRFASVEVKHVRRTGNSEADELVNAALDEEAAVGEFHKEYPETRDIVQAGIQLLQSTQGRLALDTSRAEVGRPVERAVEGDVEGDVEGADEGDAVLSTKESGNERSRAMAFTGKGTYYLRVREHFDAAHALIGYDGECKNLHGHTWDVEAEVKGKELDEVGIVYDFKDLKANLLEILAQFDHKYLNEVPPFDEFNATAENLARVVYGQLEPMLPEGISVVEVAVWESPIAKLTYRED